MDDLDGLLSSKAGGDFLSSTRATDAWGARSGVRGDPLRELLGESTMARLDETVEELAGSSTHGPGVAPQPRGRDGAVQDTWEIHDLVQEYSSKLASVKGRKLEVLTQQHQELAEDFKYNLQLIDERDALIDERDSELVQLRATLALLSEKVAARDAALVEARAREEHVRTAREAEVREAAAALAEEEREIAALRAERAELVATTDAERQRLTEEQSRLVGENIRIAERLAATRAEHDVRTREQEARLEAQAERAAADAAERAASWAKASAALEARAVELAASRDEVVEDLARARSGKEQIKVHAECVFFYVPLHFTRITLTI